MNDFTLSDLNALLADSQTTATLDNFSDIVSQYGTDFYILHSIDKDTEERRILTPFCVRHDFWSPYKYGLMDDRYRIVVKPIYDSIADEVFDSRQLIRVGRMVPVIYGGEDREADIHLRLRFGVIDTSGRAILKTSYDSVSFNGDYDLITVTNGPTAPEEGAGLFSRNGKVIVPLGAYHKIFDFDSGMARVIKADNFDKWGIIDTGGRVLLPTVYDRIWPFDGKSSCSVRTEKNGIQMDLDFESLRAGKYADDYSDDLPF